MEGRLDAAEMACNQTVECAHRFDILCAHRFEYAVTSDRRGPGPSVSSTIISFAGADSDMIELFVDTP
jgi:hypothetical protein